MRPFDSWFEAAASSLAYSLARDHAAGGEPHLAAPYNDITRFTLEQFERAPDFLRWPLLALTLGFDVAGLARYGTRFHAQAPGARIRQIEAWKKSPLSFQRDLIRYYESLATLALYSRDVPAEVRPPPTTTGPGVIEMLEDDLAAEIVVIGSGPGGAITACLLAEAGRNVLLLEEGPFYPLDSCIPFTRQEMTQKYRHGGQTASLGRNKIAYVEGRCVGGGSEINSGLYHRTPPEILDQWRREFEVQGLTEKELIPHFEANERDVTVSFLPDSAPVASLKLHEGASRLGWKSLEVPRWFRYPAAQAHEKSGIRQSMTQTFIPRFLRAGGRLVPRAVAERLRQDGQKWQVTARHAASHQTHCISAEHLFVCGGAVQTPALLRRSGITQNVGNSLRVHPTVKIVARFGEEVNSADMGVPVHQVKEFAPRLSFGCSISSPAYLALGLIDHPAASRETAATWRRTAIYYAMITSEGRGSVRALPGFRSPLVRYQLTGQDRSLLADGVRKLSQALLEAGATELYPSFTHSPVLRGGDCLPKLPPVLPDGKTNLMTIHLFSSCPMGENKRECAADSFGQVHDLRGLFINDASLLCTAPGVNPQGSIMAVARRNVLKFLGKL